MSDSVSRCLRSWVCAEDRSEPIRRWVSEDRRSRAAKYRGPQEIAVVGCGFPGVVWGAWAPKIRRQFGINHLAAAADPAEAASAISTDDPVMFDTDLTRLRAPSDYEGVVSIIRSPSWTAG
jgi:hypothetical protein